MTDEPKTVTNAALDKLPLFGVTRLPEMVLSTTGWRRICNCVVEIATICATLLVLLNKIQREYQ
jgi:hypothetical protein